jgi:cardiolipin synthase
MQIKKNKAYFNLFLTFLLVVAFIIYGLLFPHISAVYVPHVYPKATDQATLFVEPEQNDYPITDAINAAKKSVDLEVYLLSDKYVINSLINAEKRGVKVRVILEENPYKGYGANKSVKDKLSHYGVETKWANKAYALTHSKFLVIDQKTGFIMTMNLTKSSFTKNREFGIITDSKYDVEGLEDVFNADWNRNPYTEGSDNLVISPENSRRKIEALLNSATDQILIYAEEMEDEEIENLLIKKAQDGVIVKIILASPSIIQSNADAAKYLRLNGIQVKFLSSPFIHAKVAIVDKKIAYVGSVNFSTPSFDKNREIGILVSNQKVVNKLVNTFLDDFQNAIGTE